MKKKETAIVLSVSEKEIKVKVEMSSECSNCGMCSGGKNAGVLVCEKIEGIKEADKVLVEINTFGRFLSSFFTFFLPAFMLVVFLVIGEKTAGLFGENIVGYIKIGFLVLGIFAGALSIYIGNKVFLKSNRYTPKIIGKLS